MSPERLNFPHETIQASPFRFGGAMNGCIHKITFFYNEQLDHIDFIVTKEKKGEVSTYEYGNLQCSELFKTNRDLTEFLNLVVNKIIDKNGINRGVGRSEEEAVYKSLYTTREQGDKIKELTGVYPMNFWVDRDHKNDPIERDFTEYVIDYDNVEHSYSYKYECHPAYTLQELIHIAIDGGFYTSMYRLEDGVFITLDLIINRKESTSYFADYLIKILEHKKKHNKEAG